MCKKDIILSTFSSCDPHVKTVLFNLHCLSLYGGALWDVTCRQLPSLEVAFNTIADELGGSQNTAILEFCIKLHILKVFSIDLYIYLTISQDIQKDI